MESLKTLVNALRALFDGVDGKFANVQKGLAKVWDWVNGLAWVARSETIERLPETTVHFEGTWNADNQITAPLGAIINTAGFIAGQQYTVYYDGNACPMYYYVGEGGSGFFFDLDNLFSGGDFALVGNSTEWTVYLTGGASGATCDESHTFSIPAEVKPEAKLPNIFLDMDWIPKVGEVDLLTDYVIADHPDDWDTQANSSGMECHYMVTAPLFRMNEGETLMVAWGGETYSCDVRILEVESYRIPVAGNLSLSDAGEDNGLPFLFVDMYTAVNPSPEFLVFAFTIYVPQDRAEFFASSPLTVRAIRLELPEGMLPQTVREEIDGKMNAVNPSGTGYFEMNPWYDLDGDIEYTPGAYSFNVGHHGAARGDYSANIGSGHADGRNSVSIAHAWADTDGSIAIGNSATTDGTNDGDGDASGKYALAIGTNAKTSASYAVALGHGAEAASAEQVATGRYNKVDAAKKYLLILGNGGSSTSRSNAFAVTPTGDAWFAGEVYVGSTSGKDMDEGSVKLLKDGGSGDGSNLAAAYTVPETRAALKSGEKLSAALGKVAKWLGDLGGLAFKSSVSKTDLDAALQTQLTELDEDVARYKNGQLTTIAGVAIPTGGGAMAKENPTGSGALSMNRGGTNVGEYSTTLGYKNVASGSCSLAEGNANDATGECAHAEGQLTVASGDYSHAEGMGTIAAGLYQHVQGEYNIADNGMYAHIVGGGHSDDTRKNIHTLGWNGDAWYEGTLECTGIIMKSPDGTKYKVTIGNGGTLSVNVTV